MIRKQPSKAATRIQQSMGQLLNPLNVPQPGDPSTKLYANEE